jgi:hypothetical protein
MAYEVDLLKAGLTEALNLLEQLGCLQSALLIIHRTSSGALIVDRALCSPLSEVCSLYEDHWVEKMLPGTTLRHDDTFAPTFYVPCSSLPSMSLPSTRCTTPQVSLQHSLLSQVLLTL